MRKERGITQPLREGHGFTLIELMVVIVIIGLLSMVALPRFITNQKKAKESTAWADLDVMTTAMEMYYLDCDTYPVVPPEVTTDGLNALVTNEEDEASWAGPYIKYRKATSKDIPLDPWGHQYEYEGDTTDFTIWCVGGKYDASETEYSAFYIKPGSFKSP